MGKFLTAIIFLLLIPAAAMAQASTDTFDVASIKPSDPNSHNVNFNSSPGLINISGATAKLLIQEAYDVRDTQISGGPGWVGVDRFDIMAKIVREAVAPGTAKPSEDQAAAAARQRERLRNLLADRFRLKTRRETRELTVYALTIAKNGPKIKKSKADDPAPTIADNKEPGPGRGSVMRVGRGQIAVQAIPLSDLARVLSQQLGRTVIDKTGLEGDYDFTLEWAPDQGSGSPFGGPAEPSAKETGQGSAGGSESGGPTLFAAIQEQLGLKLESQKAQVEMLVIESIEKPSEN
jgi:bla regulator protein blaR1